ncbi:WD40-repeat-containing domain protein [Polychytrium aggregatum]|uniref:WD40-repeat-containing domain protein n=1 Tax=Polychytrium aggregatum TaxID=110093 RepID=UPI0022FDE0F5|nr:WD40-repeat-containing domain protein [Polychytrium aggregatum]KAI9208870.1 WD40-repeat-containing domain protein [Polychytrium aggregatum]
MNCRLFNTAKFNGYAVEYSPYFEHRLACASASNFGIIGNGRLWILNVSPNNVAVEKFYDTQDSIFDCAWSELHENHIATCSGDGSVKLWDTTLMDFPIRNWSEHGKEVSSIHWNLVKKDVFLTASWDQTIKLWHPDQPHSIATFRDHAHCVYAAIWSPRKSDVFVSASGDQTAKLWDIRTAPTAVQTLTGHKGEVLSVDWNKYSEFCVVTGSVDRTIKVWDIRQPGRIVNSLHGHEFAIRKVKCSPHDGSVVASASYDMTMRVWDINPPGGRVRFVDNNHSEFVVGLDFNMYIPGQVATCGWDEKIQVLDLPKS